MRSSVAYPGDALAASHVSDACAPCRTRSDGRVAPGTSTFSLLAAPGRFTVRLSAGREGETQPLEVWKDPNSDGTEAEIYSNRSRGRCKCIFPGSWCRRGE